MTFRETQDLFRIERSVAELVNCLQKLFLHDLQGVETEGELMEILELRDCSDRQPPRQKRFTFIDLFAGIGGMRRGVERCGGKCVYTSEWDKYARKTYMANFECDHPVSGDITKIDAKDIPRHDVLLAGFRSSLCDDSPR